MSSGETRYTARFATPDYIERARAQTLSLEVYRDGALAAPSSGTVTIYKGDGSKLVDAASISVVSSIATYALLAAVVPATLSVEDRWLEEWALVMPDGVTHTFRRPGALVLRRLYPVVTDSDLEAQYGDLASALMPSAITSWQAKIDEAWSQILGRLLEAGNFPYLVMDPYVFRTVHVDLTLSLIFSEFHSSTGDQRWADQALAHRLNWIKGWSRISFRYDTDHDGSISNGRQSAGATLWLTDSSSARRGIRGLPWSW